MRRDLAAKTIGEVGSRLGVLLFFFYVARKVSAAGFGTLSVVLSVAVLLGVVFLDPGLNIVTVQRVVQLQASAVHCVGAVLALKLLLMLPVVGVVLLGAYFGGGRLPALSLMLAGLYVLCTAIFEFFCSITNGFHRMDLEAVLKIGQRLLTVCLGLGVIVLVAPSVDGVLLALVVGMAIGCVAAWWAVRGECVPLALVWDPTAMLRALRLGFPVAGTYIITAVYLKWDMPILSFFNIEATEIGWYAGAYRLLEALSAIPGILGSAIFPTLVHLRSHQDDRFPRLLLLSIKLVLLSSLPLACLLGVFSREVIVAVYGKAYEPGGAFLSILAWSVVPIFCYFFLVFVNVAGDCAEYNVYSGLCSLMTGLVANLVLTPHLGSRGVAWAGVCANSVFAFLALRKAAPIVGVDQIVRIAVRLLACGTVLLLVLLVVPLGPIRRAGVGIMAYLAMTIALRVVTSHDVSAAFRMIWPRVRPALS